MKHRTTIGIVAFALLMAAPAGAQVPTATVTPQSAYRASGFKAWLLGDNYREIWTTPVTVPVLDIGTFAGGLEPERQGGRQSHTLHFQGADGHLYIFRSVDKFLYKAALPRELHYTPAGAIAQDQISSLHPSSAVAVSHLQTELGLLHAPPQLVVMPDDPRLGEFRERFAGLLGWIEENPQEGPDDTPGFAGSSKVVGTDKILERLDESGENILDSREYLAARFVDFLIGDTDRGGDNWRFASFPGPKGTTLWRPVPRDRDYAFMKSDGALMVLVRGVYPKMENYGRDNGNLRSLAFMTRDMDRRFLADVPKAAWDSVVTAVRASLTDDVLRAAVDRMPPEYSALSGARIVEVLRARRDNLGDLADEFYAMVATQAEMHAVDEPDLATVTWLEDGRLDVRIQRAVDGVITETPYLARTFVPGETREVRLYMHGKDDRVVVWGPRAGAIKLRVIGGGGDDRLVDSTTAGPGSVAFYDHRGENTFVTNADTRVDEKPYDHPAPGRPQDLQLEASLEAEADESEEAGEKDADAGEKDADAGAEDTRIGDGEDDVGTGDAQEDSDNWIRTRTQHNLVRDWGATRSIRPAFDYRDGAGVIVGAGLLKRQYGFRRIPFRTQFDVAALYATGSGGFGVDGGLEYRPENVRMGIGIRARVTQFDAFRFFGLGNDSPLPDDVGRTLIMQDEARVHPYVKWDLGDRGTFSFGPEYRRFDPERRDPMAGDDGLRFGRSTVLPGFVGVSQVGGRADLAYATVSRAAFNSRGVMLSVGGAHFPAALDLEKAYSEVHGEARTYIPLGSTTHIALRAGGKHIIGDEFPIQDAAFLGGRFDLRGHRFQRFAGETAAFGNAELRLPVTEAELFVRGDLGILALVDAGRVWFAEEEADDIHTAYGGGLWFASLGRAVSVVYARGEEDRFYVNLGMPF